MDETAPLSDQDTRNLRFLRVLVTVLTATMILGVLSIVVLLVIRLQAPSGPTFPESIALPEGVEPTVFTQGTGWYAVVTADNRILIFNQQDGTLHQEIAILPLPGDTH